MTQKYTDIHDQLMKNSKWNGECLESTYKRDPKKPWKCAYFTHKSKLMSVPRAMWEYVNGKIPQGLFICHRCDNPLCFRIEHLFLGTPKDNVKDMVSKKRDNIFGRRKYSREFFNIACELRALGMSYNEIAKKLEARFSAIAAMLNRAKIKKGPTESKPKRYTQNIVNEILKMKNQGYRNIDIQKEMNIPECSLWRILKIYTQK